MQQTQITIQRPDGTTETVTKPGTITSQSVRRQMTSATRAAGRGEIIGWQIVGQAPTGPTAQQILYGRNRATCKGCGRVGCDGDCGRGNY